MPCDYYVFLDMDGILVDFCGGWFAKAGVDFSWDDHPPMNPYIDQLLGLSDDEFWACIYADPKFWENLNPTEEFALIVERLKPLFNEGQVFLLSVCHYLEGCLGKLRWRDKYLPGVPCFFTKSSSEKKHFATSNAILLDDFDESVIAFSKSGGNSFLVPRYWNSLFKIADNEGVLVSLDRFFNFLEI